MENVAVAMKNIIAIVFHSDKANHRFTCDYYAMYLFNKFVIKVNQLETSAPPPSNCIGDIVIVISQ